MAIVESTKFPIIYFNKHSFFIVDDIDKLTITTKAGLRNKIFDDLMIVDSSGKCYKVSKVEKLHGIGFLWGYNIFLNQRIKVKLNFSENVSEIALQDLKALIMKFFNKDKYFWESGGNLKQLKEIVDKSESISMLIKNLSKVINKEY